MVVRPALLPSCNATRSGSRHPLAIAAGASLLLHVSAADAASSASFEIPGSTFDVAGGTASSPSFQVTSCLGSEIAGSAASINFRIDSGCGAVLGFAASGPVLAYGTPIPTLSATAGVLLAVMTGAVALLQVRRRLTRTALVAPRAAAAARQ